MPLTGATWSSHTSFGFVYISWIRARPLHFAQDPGPKAVGASAGGDPAPSRRLPCLEAGLRGWGAGLQLRCGPEVGGSLAEDYLGR